MSTKLPKLQISFRVFYFHQSKQLRTFATSRNYIIVVYTDVILSQDAKLMWNGTTSSNYKEDQRNCMWKYLLMHICPPQNRIIQFSELRKCMKLKAKIALVYKLMRSHLDFLLSCNWIPISCCNTCLPVDVNTYFATHFIMAINPKTS